MAIFPKRVCTEESDNKKLTKANKSTSTRSNLTTIFLIRLISVKFAFFMAIFVPLIITDGQR
ncbi:MAG: hypothetical protein APF83_08610 [Lutibacter sp. BRH_c52]|nr:MAG: hypothetical protein APF83_08610 [Lutibacter sp. BRH_c52]